MLAAYRMFSKERHVRMDCTVPLDAPALIHLHPTDGMLVDDLFAWCQ
jgi:hypothetical protein